MTAQAFIIMATALYVAQVVLYLVSGKNPQALVMVGYIIANLGLIWSAL